MVSTAESQRATRAGRREPGARRIVLAGAGTATALVLLFGYHTSTQGVGGPHPSVVAAGPVSGTSSSTGSGSSTGGGSASGSSSGTVDSGTYTGGVAQTMWGPVQVRIAVSGGKVTDAQAVVVPSGNMRDVSINRYAVPILNQEAVQASSAQIDAVSGATVTSDGYIASLQSALDAAGLKG
ncbi:MAG: FMN-binding protein [Motilibacteraceae bacterium]